MTDQRNPQADAIDQPEEPGPRAFMRRAETMRRAAITSGDQAYGAVVVKDGRIVGQAPSRVVVNTDPTGHAEMETIRDASRRLGRGDLSGCEMYSTSRPCTMCETAAYWAGISGLRYGSDMESGGRPRYRSC